jgi:hypothetical protein
MTTRRFFMVDDVIEECRPVEGVGQVENGRPECPSIPLIGFPVAAWLILFL